MIVDTCQDSNQAFEGADAKVDEDGTLYFYDDPTDGHSYFGYRVLGKIGNDAFALFHGGYVGLYRLYEKEVDYDFLTVEKGRARILEKISQSWMPCFESGTVQGDVLVVRKRIWDQNASRSSQCTKNYETLEIDLGWLRTEGPRPAD